MQPPPAHPPGRRAVQDKFAVLGFPPAYALEAEVLDERFRALSRKLHPDRFARATAQERRYSLEQTTLLNDAYRTLKDPVRRAEHLLELRGIHLGEEPGPRAPGEAAPSKVALPPEFLEQAMEDREKLLEAKLEGGPEAVARLADGVRQKRDDTMAQIASRLHAQSLLEAEPDLNAVAELLARLRYYARYLDEVEGREPEM